MAVQPFMLPGFEAKKQPVNEDFVKSLMSAVASPYSLTRPKGESMTIEEALASAGAINTVSGAAVLTGYAAGILAEATSLGQLESIMEAVNNAIETFGIGSVMRGIIASPVNSGLLPVLERHWRSIYKPSLPDANTAAILHAKGVLSGDDYYGIMPELGFTFKLAQAMDWGAEMKVDWRSALEMHRLGLINDSDARKNMRMLGLPDWLVGVIMSRKTAEVPEAYRLALQASRYLLTPEEYLAGMAANGLSQKWANAYLAASYEIPGFAQLAEMRWRGLINDDEFGYYLYRSGILPATASKLIEISRLIPPAQDLVTMVVREAFVPEMVTPAPEVFAENMAKKGFSKEWSDRYWTMHWVPMPLAQAYANLHRGYWTKEQFMNLLKIADIHPMWREDIYNVAFVPPSIRELGYGYDVGAYTEEDILRYRRWGGLSPEDAKKATTSLVAYRTEAERNAVRTELMYAYGRGSISIEEFEAEIIALGTAAAAVPLWVERAELYRDRVSTQTTPEEPPSLTRSNAQWLFEHGMRDVDWLRSALKDLGYTEDTIQAYVDISKQKMKEAEAKVEVVKPRDLTVAQIRSLYLAGMIYNDDLHLFYEELGYSSEYADALAKILIAEVTKKAEPKQMTMAQLNDLYDLQLLSVSQADIVKSITAIVDKEIPPSNTAALVEAYYNLGYSAQDSQRLALYTVISLTLSDLRAKYSKGWISSSEMFNAILDIGVPRDRANSLMMGIVKAEQPTRTAAEKDLTKAEIIKGAKTGVLTTGQAVGLLEGIGYDENEAWYLLYINAVVARSDPETYWEMRKVVEAQKKAKGEVSVEVPDELITLELQLRDMKARLEQAKAAKATEEELGRLAVELANIEARMRTIIAKAKLA